MKTSSRPRAFYEGIMKTKIIYLITKSNWGGAQRYVYDLATQVPPERFDVVVAAGPHTNIGVGAGGDGLLFERLDGAGIRTIRLALLRRDISVIREFKALRDLIRLFRVECPDIVHLNSSKVGGLGAVAVKIAALILRKKIRIVFTAHGWGFYEDRRLPARVAIFAASFISAILQDAVITITTADWRAARRFIPARKLHLIFNGIEEKNIMPRPAARDFLAQKIAPPMTDDTLLVGTIAELTENKGLLSLIDAVKILQAQTNIPPIRFLIIGEGEQRQILEIKIRNQRVERTITLLGFNPDARGALAGLDIFVLPSVKEGLPYAVMEAMTATLPVVATRVGGLSDLITSGKDGILVPPKNPLFLARAIAMLASDPDLRRRLGERGCEKIKTTFSFHAMINATIKLYRDL